MTKKDSINHSSAESLEDRIEDEMELWVFFPYGHENKVLVILTMDKHDITTLNEFHNKTNTCISLVSLPKSIAKIKNIV